jgi:hypothetical protein
MGKNPVHGDTRAAYHGLVRAYIRSTADRATSAEHRRHLRGIDVRNRFIESPCPLFASHGAS